MTALSFADDALDAALEIGGIKFLQSSNGSITLVWEYMRYGQMKQQLVKNSRWYLIGWNPYGKWLDYVKPGKTYYLP
jgi:hypothetical protein